MSTITGLQLPRLGKQKMAQIASKAKRLGMTPQRYIRQLIEEDLALDEKAKTMSFAQIISPANVANEAVLDQVVDEARARHHSNSRRKR